MVTKYDVFHYVYQKGVVTSSNTVFYFKNSVSYHQAYQFLDVLTKEKLLVKKGKEYALIHSKKAESLYKLIQFCSANGINYNVLLEKNIVRFIKTAAKKNRFSIKDFKLNPRTFGKYVDVLARSGVLIILSKKPLEATIPINSFIKELLEYFGEKVAKRKKGENYKDEIEKELSIFRKKKKKNEMKYKEVVETYEIRFVQHSLNLEGNPITLPETIKLLKEQIVAHDMAVETVQEVQNYQNAVQEMLKDAAEKRKITKQLIIKYHALAMQHKPDIAGKIRTVSVIIKNNPQFKIAKVNEIEQKLTLLLEKYNAFILKKRHSVEEILTFAAYFHNEFQHIHPFLDGNSRTTRLLTFHFLRFLGIPVIDIPLGLLEEYLFSTKGARKRNDKELMNVIQRIILYNLKTINEQL